MEGSSGDTCVQRKKVSGCDFQHGVYIIVPGSITMPFTDDQCGCVVLSTKKEHYKCARELC